MMSGKMFVNLPVRVLDESMAFFRAIGCSFNPQFTDETAACLVISEHNFVMLLTEAKWNQMIPRPISDTKLGSEAVICLSLETKEDVASIVANALAAGATRISDPDDYGFMFQDGFQDLDGHLWSFFWMDPGHIRPAE
ncbi:MAG: glyoxalase/bleomycin resistance/extradiol dioxygenase family protein [Planctomycetaceae bacterium]